jgi:hypothetical protein
MTLESDIKEINQSTHTVLTNIDKGLYTHEFSNEFTLDGNKVTLSLVSENELFIQQCSGSGLFSSFIPNFYNKSEIILTANIISIRSKDSKQLVSRLTAQSKRGALKSIHETYRGWLRLNQTLTINHSSLTDKYVPGLSYKESKLVLPSSYEAPVYHGCGTGILIDYVVKDVNNRWSRKTLCFRHTDSQIVANWRNKLEETMLHVSTDRPKKLLIFVNPFGGRGDGKCIFYNKVAPLLRLSGVKFDVVITERANHAKDMLQKCSLEGIGGVVCVGGDGMFSEIFTGILLRTEREANGDLTQLRKGRMRVGVIPAGKTL